MFTSVRDLVGLWRHEASQTVKVMAALTDASLTQRVAPGYRSLGELAWHIAGAPLHFLVPAGVTYNGPDMHVPHPPRAAEIRSVYEDVQTALATEVERTWSDGSLGETQQLFGHPRPRGMIVLAMLHHEIHHRGQMTVLMRQAGLEVPGVYGPAKGE